MSITATERTQIVELTTLMFNAAPGATYLSQIVALYEANGHNLSVLADQLASTSIYQSMNPSFQTAAEFATKFLTPLGLAGDAFANSWITSQLNAGVSKQQVAYAAMQALMNLDPNASAQYQAAKAVLVNKTTVAEYYSATLLGAATDLATLQTVIGSVTADPASVTSSEAVLNNQIITGITQALTTGVDNFNGTSGNDTFNSQIGAGANSTLTALDSINGGTGTDTLNINDLAGSTAMPGGVTIQNVEIINLASAGAATFDVSGVSGLTNFNVTQSTGVDVITAGAGQAVNVTDTAGNVTVTGGSAQTVATSAGSISLSGATGAIAVTDTKIAANTVNITDGSNVSVTATGVANAAAAAQFTIGSATNAPSGTVTVSSTGAATTAGANNVLGNISVTGGTSVAVTEVATSDASSVAKDAVGSTVTLGDVSVAGNGTVTSVSVTQTPEATQTGYTKLTPGAIETDTVTVAHAVAPATTYPANTVVTFNGLTFTTAKALTDAQIASAFANLSNGATQGSAPASYGIYSGTFGTDMAGSTGAETTTATGSSVTFTAAASGASTLTAATGVTVTNVVTGSADTGADQAGVLGVTDGLVAINDGATKSITSVTLDGYGAGSSITADLTTLNLAHSNNGVAVTNAAATSLNLGLNGVGDATHTPTVSLGANYKTLNIVDTAADSVAAVNATGATALAISGDHAVDLSGATFGALKTVTVSGGAGVKIDVSGQPLTDFNASATSGNNTVTLNTGATYEGGSGTDKVTTTGAVTHAISLGAGNDTLTLAGGTTTLGAVVSGGDGTDTLKMNAADAILASASNAFEANFNGFEKLSLGANGATGTVDLANMNGINYVVSAGGAAALTIKDMANGGTLELTAANAVGTTVSLTDATGTADSLNVVTKVSTADINFGNVTAAGVESINFTATDLDTSTTTGGGVNKATVKLIDAAVKTIVITGNSNFALTLDPTDLAVTSIDGSAMTGKLTASTSVTGGATIMGGSGSDTLTANGNGDTLLGNGGNDTLIVNGNLDTLTGGAGKDTFNVAAATTNVNSYATITDFSSGDKIQFAATATSFAAAKITLGSTAVFQDYANAAIAGTAAGNVSWFQYGGDTYVIDNVSGSTSFVNHSDVIVKLTGTVDLSADSFSSTAHTLLAV